jgi:hypothetical protein
MIVRDTKRGLTRLRNSDVRIRGAQIKVEEKYLRVIDNNVAKCREQLQHLISFMNRKVTKRSPSNYVLDQIVSDKTSSIILVPAFDMLHISMLDFFEQLSLSVRRCLFLETVVEVLRIKTRQLNQSRVDDLQKHPDISCIFFSNEHCSNVHVSLEPNKTEEQRRAKAICKSIVWLQEVFNKVSMVNNFSVSGEEENQGKDSSISISGSNISIISNNKEIETIISPRLILLTEDRIMRDVASSLGIKNVCNCNEILSILKTTLRDNTFTKLECLSKTLLKERLLLESEEEERQKRKKEQKKGNDSGGGGGGGGGGVMVVDENNFKLNDFFNYYDTIRINMLLQRNVLHIGTFNHDQHYKHEGWCTDVKEVEGVTQILLKGRGSINRALHGDTIVIRLLHKSKWRSSESAVKLSGGASMVKGGTKELDKIVPTGVVVGIMKEGCRQYVATLQPLEDEDEKEADDEGEKKEEDVGSSSSSSSGGRERYLLAVPMNKRIPKIRIRTRQYKTLRRNRLLVAIDHWDVNSMYPEGHVIRLIGKCGALQTEAECLLLEHSLTDHMRPFSFSAMSELPRLPPAIHPHPPKWQVPLEEVKRRRDYRKNKVECIYI